jgi:flavodoxin I
MKALIVYDSYFGNTEKIVGAIAQALEPQLEITSIHACEVKMEQLSGLDFLLVGSPTRGFRPSEATTAFLKKIPAGALNGIKVVAFDTRVSAEDIKNPFLTFLTGLFGYAASPIAKQLSQKGGQLAATPEGFFVKESIGPLKDGELERAASWASSLIKG